MIPFDKEEIYNLALSTIETKKVYNIESLTGFLPCSRATFYVLFPLESDELDTIKRALFQKSVETKSLLMEKWKDGDNATTQIALMKMICTDEEAHRLNGSRQVVENNTRITERKVVSEYNIDELTLEELDELERINLRAIEIRDKCKTSTV